MSSCTAAAASTKSASRTRFDLVIVDEAHKFRNDTADAYDELQRICKTPTRRRLKDNALARKKVILEEACGGLSMAELAPAIILSESFSGH